VSVALTDQTGLREWTTDAGFHVLQIHYTADPDKRSEEWKRQARQGLDDLGWDREFELNWSSVEGLPVFRHAWESEVHVAKTPLAYLPEIPVVRGWDFGLMPACVFSQFTPGGRWNVLAEVQGLHTGIRSLCRLIKAEYLPRFPGAKYEDYCDPAGFSQSQTDEKTCAEIMAEELGQWPNRGIQTWTERYDAVSEWLRGETEDGTPLFQMNSCCHILKQGFEGAYHYREMAEGRFKEEPEKNRFSHLQDALQYPATCNRLGQGLVLHPTPEQRGKIDCPHEWVESGAVAGMRVCWRCGQAEKNEADLELEALAQRADRFGEIGEDVIDHLRELGIYR